MKLPSSTFNFDCSAASAGIPQELFACFRVTTAQDSFVGMDVDLDLIVNDPGLPDWWHFESCNASGFALTLARNSALCVGALSPWGTQNAGGAGFTPSTHGPNTGHFHGAAARSLPFRTARNPFDDVDLREDVRRMLNRLAPRQRAALVLLDLYGYGSEEAGKILGVRASTVRALATQGRAVLRSAGGIDA